MAKYRTRWLALAICVLACGSARADTLTLNSWQVFDFGGVGTTSGPFTFSGPALLEVTDAFVPGDQFEVFDNGVLLGETSTPTFALINVSDPDSAFGNPDFSSGSWALGDGPHSITIETIASLTGGGEAYIQADSTAAPEPASLILLGIGTIGAVGVVRRRKLQAA